MIALFGLAKTIIAGVPNFAICVLTIVALVLVIGELQSHDARTHELIASCLAGS